MASASSASHESQHRHRLYSDEEELRRYKGGADNAIQTESCPVHISRCKDPKAKWVQEWNRVFLIVCAAGLFIDPLFFYALAVDELCMCLYIDGWFGLTVTALRCMTDVLHVWNMWVRLRLGKERLGGDDQDEEEMSRGGSQRRRFVFTKRALMFDIFVVLPLPQVLLWVAIPHMLARGSTTLIMDLFLILFLIQYLPKIYHSVLHLLRLQKLSGYIFGTAWWGLSLNLISYFVASHAVGACWYLLGLQRASECLGEQCSEKNGCELSAYHSVLHLLRLQKLSGYIFGTAWWGLSLNLISYFVASHAVGACWYLLGLQRASECLGEQCSEKNGCEPGFLTCKPPVYYGASNMRTVRNACFENRYARSTCLLQDDAYSYGAYTWVVQLVANPNRLEKILFPIFWGLMTLSTFGNLESTTDWLELTFNIIVLTSGLLLVTMLIGNIKVFLSSTTSKKQAMQIKMRNIEWWMKKRRLPAEFRQRVRNYERQRWAAMRGVDESEMISNLPEGLRRDIKYHLCLDLVRQVPLFQHMDDLVLENICDRVKSLIFTKGETIAREGDPVKRMIFVVRGHLQCSQVVRDGLESCCMLGPGNFSGDELISWCLRRPFIERLPPSSSTLVTLETTEVFGLEAEDVKYVTRHFRYTFLNEKVKRSARYYSPGWRTWAAVAVQLAWRRHKHHRLTLRSLSFIRPRRPCSRTSSPREEDRLKLYTALLTSPKPNQDDFDF